MCCPQASVPKLYHLHLSARFREFTIVIDSELGQYPMAPRPTEGDEAGGHPGRSSSQNRYKRTLVAWLRLVSVRGRTLLSVLADNPFRRRPPFEKLVGDFHGEYSRRINIQHRLVYQVIDDERTVKVIRMWSHYE